MIEKYFSIEEIVKILCRKRIKEASKRHKGHLAYEIGHTQLCAKELEKLESELGKQIFSLLPSRKEWHSTRRRHGRSGLNTQFLNNEAIYRAVIKTHTEVQLGITRPPNWYLNLMDFIENIKNRIKSDDFSFSDPKIIPLRKESSPKCTKCRPLSIYNLEDTVIIGVTAKYLRELCDDKFESSSFAFRAKRLGHKTPTHHDTIDKISKFKRTHKSDLWVAECDIKKFFDCISHEIIQSCLKEFALEHNKEINSTAQKIFDRYLDSYSFNHNVMPLNNEADYFKKYEIQDGKFEWAEAELKNFFYGENISKFYIGIPQGGALSCIIANLVLHKADICLKQLQNSNNQLYLRYCDDMVLIDRNKESCQSSLEAYITTLNELKLLVHEPKPVPNYGKAFWDPKEKSKLPYLWGSTHKDPSNIPWLAFVGYQIRYDCSIRVRKKSFLKEKHKQKAEIMRIYHALELASIETLDINSKKSRKQQMHSITQKLISMSVGRRELHNYNWISSNLCWTNGFKSLQTNYFSKGQLRELDRSRNRELYKLKLKLKGLSKQSAPKSSDKKKPTRIYYGAPFSYHGFLDSKK
jgi:hypothetical protein